MIYIDSRAGSNELQDYIPKSLPRCITQLPYGDVMFEGNGPDSPVAIGIEYKKISDLVNSIISGRLSGYQLIGLMREYYRVYLLVEGVFRPNPEDGILEVLHRGWEPLRKGRRSFMFSEVANYLNTLQVVCGITVWRTSNQRESGDWIGSTFQWWQKKWEDHHSHKQFCTLPPKVTLIRPTLVHRIAKEFEGISWDRGQAIAARFSTPWGLMNAIEPDLCSIPGIGKKLAASIIKEIGRDGQDSA